jgi:hypothetical protein
LWAVTVKSANFELEIYHSFCVEKNEGRGKDRKSMYF